ncbi:Flp family type IVb pilin [Sphingomonadaceae bacterium OTU29MARTA1]|uniref:Flp family type IVb pilin n=1 Tax=Sphingomonas sp. Leaf37 TaxID=2876552 RepID=UPI001E4AD6B8|nr:Flp family type IVb pilin [Sphingomonas sp. Leaf37]USU05829.1 Flp family type IVb pilin [Sphingomonadaceae bacterium OTU29LAMAA1]USU09310.1 Flp family type IVb pilin [Sphingomonadaceae bacterium OTU29MARTA1]USU12710.1 Flp family type IVb pilin [Sphingomonadaceae bacterium OTU29THOMA1]
MKPRSLLRRLTGRVSLSLRDSRGATAVEYGLILALIVIVMIVALKQVANANTDMWRNVSDKVVAAG